MPHYLHTRTVDQTEQIANKANSAYFQSNIKQTYGIQH